MEKVTDKRGQVVMSPSSTKQITDAACVQSSSVLKSESAEAAGEEHALLVFSHLRWHFVTQRPQHLLTRAARTRKVFFWEEPWIHEPGVTQEFAREGGTLEFLPVDDNPNVIVIRPHFFRGEDVVVGQRCLLNDFLEARAIRRFDRWYYTPMALVFSNHLHADVTVYDCMDELSAFAGAPPELIDREKELFRVADVVFTGGRSIFEAKRAHHPRVHAFPSSIDVQHFAQARVLDLEPSDQSSIPHPRAGFFGVLDERFDRDLMAEVASLRPKVQFVLIGPVVKIDPSLLPQAPNIHYLGGKSYNDLPAYLAGWNVALLPFAINEATRFISPTKTPEYLAAGKRVVSTPIRDVVADYGKQGLVDIAATALEFANAIDGAMAGGTDEWQTRVQRKLASSSWDRTWKQMDREMDAVRKGRAKFTDRAPKQVRVMPQTDEEYDYVVVGAGFAGAVVAERLATQLDKQVLILDRRPHIGGNTYDFYNEHGILVHKYGPHIFHTSSQKVVDYLSHFTEWRPYEHRVLASVDNKYLPVPINLDTVNRLYDLDLDSDGMEKFLAERVEKPAEIRSSEDIVLSRVGRDLYEKFFRNYTRKQWGLDPAQLDSSVAGRIPVRFDRDDRYFTDAFQAMPLKGFTHMFERMLDDPRISIQLSVDYREILHEYPRAKVIYTGPIDEFFDYCYGPLPYRSLRFQHETHAMEQYQPAPVVNYPNEHAYTRVTEFKYLTGQKHEKTSIVYEYPTDEGDPYYPIPRPENAALYEKYKALAEARKNVYFCGRLANYRYFNMDQVVAQALHLFSTIAADEAAAPVVARVAVGSQSLTAGEAQAQAS